MKMLYTALVPALLFAVMPASAQEPDISGLRIITQAGGSLVIDLDKRQYTVGELKTLAESLKYDATLTIKMGAKRRLTAQQCAQIAQSHPGHVIFWF